MDRARGATEPKVELTRSHAHDRLVPCRELLLPAGVLRNQSAAHG